MQQRLIQGTLERRVLDREQRLGQEGEMNQIEVIRRQRAVIQRPHILQRKAVGPSAKPIVAYPSRRNIVSTILRTQIESSMIRIKGCPTCSSRFSWIASPILVLILSLPFLPDSLSPAAAWNELLRQHMVSVGQV